MFKISALLMFAFLANSVLEVTPQQFPRFEGPPNDVEHRPPRLNFVGEEDRKILHQQNQHPPEVKLQKVLNERPPIVARQDHTRPRLQEHPRKPERFVPDERRVGEPHRQKQDPRNRFDHSMRFNHGRKPSPLLNREFEKPPSFRKEMMENGPQVLDVSGNLREMWINKNKFNGDQHQQNKGPKKLKEIHEHKRSNSQSNAAHEVLPNVKPTPNHISNKEPTAKIVSFLNKENDNQQIFSSTTQTSDKKPTEKINKAASQSIESAEKNNLKQIIGQVMLQKEQNQDNTQKPQRPHKSKGVEGLQNPNKLTDYDKSQKVEKMNTVSEHRNEQSMGEKKIHYVVRDDEQNDNDDDDDDHDDDHDDHEGDDYGNRVHDEQTLQNVLAATSILIEAPTPEIDVKRHNEISDSDNHHLKNTRPVARTEKHASTQPITEVYDETQKHNQQSTDSALKATSGIVKHTPTHHAEASALGDKALDAEYEKSKAFGLVSAPNSFLPVCRPTKMHLFSEDKIKCACHFKCRFDCTSTVEEKKTPDEPKHKQGRPRQMCRRVCSQKMCYRPAYHYVFTYKLQHGMCMKSKRCAFKATCKGDKHRWIQYNTVGCERTMDSYPHPYVEMDNIDADVISMMHNKKPKVYETPIPVSSTMKEFPQEKHLPIVPQYYKYPGYRSYQEPYWHESPYMRYLEKVKYI